MDSLSSFRIGKVEFSYSVAIPEPLQLDRTGCALHLDACTIADVADGSPLTAGWTDVSNSGVVATGATPPVYLADGGGGYPSVRFDGVDDYLHASVSTGNQVSVFVVFALQRTAAPSNYRDILLTGANGGDNLSLASSRASASAPDCPSFNGLEHTALDFQTWVNGHHTGEVTGDLFRGRYYIGTAIDTNVSAEDALTIGARGVSGVNAGQNDIRELIVYDRALTENERFAVEAYLASKYKIAAVTRALAHPVESYPHATLPSERAYADRAVMVLAAISLQEYAPDLSNPWPDRIEIQDRGSLVIPDTVEGVSVNPLQATIYSRLGRVMPTATMNWSIAPEGRGVSVDPDGNVLVRGNGSPDLYTISAV
ncbi:MAG: hypothetical protein HOO08_01000 [Opitutae bacterium]|nr:hypothetical protein [Opitutae bacterium]